MNDASNKDRPLIQLSQLSKVYHTSSITRKILHQVNLDIYPGDFIAITGPSGSGKSTLLNIIGLLDTPSSGVYYFKGTNTTHMSEDAKSSLRKHSIGMVFQNFCLLPHRTVYENVLFRFRYVNTTPSFAAVQANIALAKVALLDKHKNQKARLLSGGEMQRVAIARAIAQIPDVLLVDEPTGNLDHSSAKRIMEIFYNLHTQGLTILMVTHNEKLLSYVSRQLHCESGRID